MSLVRAKDVLRHYSVLNSISLGLRCKALNIILLGRSFMRIDYERSGGFAGIRMSTSVDSDSLPLEQAEEIRAALEEADFFQLPSRIIPGLEKTGGVDRFQYRVTVHAQDRHHTVEVGEAAVPENLWSLLNLLNTIARTKR